MKCIHVTAFWFDAQETLSFNNILINQYFCLNYDTLPFKKSGVSMNFK